MRKRVPPLHNSKNPQAKLAAKPPALGALFSNIRGVERGRAYLIVLEVFGPLGVHEKVGELKKCIIDILQEKINNLHVIFWRH